MDLGSLDATDPGDHLECRDGNLHTSRSVRQDPLVRRRGGDLQPSVEVRAPVSQEGEPSSGQGEQRVVGRAADPGDGVEPPLQRGQPAAGHQLAEPPEHHVRGQLDVTGGQRVAHRRLVFIAARVPFHRPPMQAGRVVRKDGRELCLQELREQWVITDQAITVLRHHKGVARPHQPS